MTCQMEAGRRLGDKQEWTLPIFFQGWNLQTPIGMLGMVALELFKYVLKFFKSGFIFCFVQ